LPNPIRKRNADIKKLRRLAVRNEIDLWFEDECHFQQHGSRCTMWIPPENIDPVLLHAPTRRGFGVFGAVRVDDGRLVTSLEEKFNAMTFHSFLRKILRHRRCNRKILVILDNARWHHANILRPWLAKHREAIELDFLPPYSPELNAIERVWKLTRKLCCHNRYFPTLEELMEIVFDKFESWAKPNETLRRLCAII
jgi:transposase